MLWLSKKLIKSCRGPNVVVGDGQVDAPNCQLISCLDSSLGRVAACGAGVRRFARDMFVRHGALLEDRDDPGKLLSIKSILLGSAVDRWALLQPGAEGAGHQLDPHEGQ